MTTEGDLDRLAEWANRNLTKYIMGKCSDQALRKKNPLQ